MAKIVDDVHSAAAWIATALSSSGYTADFSAQSLWEIDRFFDEHSNGGSPKPGGLLAQDLGARLFALGSYVGEVIRRDAGGEWRGDDADPQAEITVQLVVGTSICWPVQRVMKRLKNGAEDGIAVYGSAMGLDVGPRPESPAQQQKPWWKFW